MTFIFFLDISYTVPYLGRVLYHLTGVCGVIHSEKLRGGNNCEHAAQRFCFATYRNNCFYFEVDAKTIQKQLSLQPCIYTRPFLGMARLDELSG